MWKTITFLFLLAQSVWKEILIFSLKIFYHDCTCAGREALWYFVIYLYFCIWKYNYDCDRTQCCSGYLNNFSWKNKKYIFYWLGNTQCEKEHQNMSDADFEGTCHNLKL